MKTVYGIPPRLTRTHAPMLLMIHGAQLKIKLCKSHRKIQIYRIRIMQAWIHAERRETNKLRSGSRGKRETDTDTEREAQEKRNRRDR